MPISRHRPWVLLSALLACGGDDGGSGASQTATGASAGATDASGSATESGGVTSGPGTASATTSGGTGGASTDSGASDGTGGVGTGPCGSDDASPTLWCPGPGTSWQWQLTGTLDMTIDVAMYDIDLFDTDASIIGDLQSAGRIVVCYFSAGSHEDWRPDADQYPAEAIGDPLDGWPGERWVDVRSSAVRQILAARLDTAVSKGCDGVEPDNVDGYSNQTGFPLTADDQLEFNRWLATESHARGLSVGLKNDLDQVPALLADFDWALNEECMAWDECDALSPFIQAGKAVFHVEYVDAPADGQALADQVCPAANDLSFSTLIKEWDLLAWRIAC